MIEENHSEETKETESKKKGRSKKAEGELIAN